MGLELDLKLARIADEFTSENLHIAKDRAAPLFLSTETDSLFILTAHLRGYNTRNVKIEINDDGTQMVISGEKTVQENVFVGWKLYKKEAEIKRFRKAFKIPEGVILDKIKAKFDEDESVLTVSMPKKEKGIRGFNIEEVKEQVHASGSSETLQVASENPKDDVSEKKVNYGEETKETDMESLNTPRNKELEQHVEDAEYVTQKQKNDHDDNDIQENHENFTGNKTNDEEFVRPEKLSPICTTTKAEIIASEQDREKIEEKPMEKELNEENSVKDQIQGNVEEGEVKSSEEHQEVRPLGNNEEKGSFKICVPAIAGSAFLLSLVVFVIHYVKTKTQSDKRNN